MFYEKIIHTQGSSFSHKTYDSFTMPWHHHPEFELIVICSGGGKRFVGDSMESFHPGDLVLLGSNLPHFHMCYGLLEGEPSKISQCEVIQFTQDIFPESLLQLFEMQSVAELLEKSKRGIKFINPPSIERVTRMMRHMDNLTGVRRISVLFRILEFLAGSFEHRMLSSGKYSINLVGGDKNDPVNKAYRYLLDNFRSEISLDEIASYIGFNTSALCRHFKKHAQRSIFECLSDIRIGFACKLLLNSNLSVSQIAFESGYSNIANFNRQFKSITGTPPLKYKQLHQTHIAQL